MSKKVALTEEQLQTIEQAIEKKIPGATITIGLSPQYLESLPDDAFPVIGIEPGADPVEVMPGSERLRHTGLEIDITTVIRGGRDDKAADTVKRLAQFQRELRHVVFVTLYEQLAPASNAKAGRDGYTTPVPGNPYGAVTFSFTTSFLEPFA